MEARLRRCGYCEATKPDDAFVVARWIEKRHGGTKGGFCDACAAENMRKWAIGKAAGKEAIDKSIG